MNMRVVYAFGHWSPKARLGGGNVAACSLRTARPSAVFPPMRGGRATKSAACAQPLAPHDYSPNQSGAYTFPFRYCCT